MRQQILVDMDGVLADVYAQLIIFEYRDSGIKLNIENMYGKTELEAFPSFEKHVRSKGFFRTAPLIPGSIEGLKYLNEKYNVLIVSSATEFPQSLNEKEEWLSEHFPFITWEQMIFCGRKDSIRGNIMIDDHPKNLSTFDGERYLFAQPHNMCMPDRNYHRVSGWQDIIRLL